MILRKSSRTWTFIGTRLHDLGTGIFKESGFSRESERFETGAGPVVEEKEPVVEAKAIEKTPTHGGLTKKLFSLEGLFWHAWYASLLTILVRFARQVLDIRG